MGSAASRPSGPPFVVWSGTGDLAGGGSDWGVRLPVPLGRQRVLIRNLLRFALPRFLVCAGWGQATCASSWVERQHALFLHALAPAPAPELLGFGSRVLSARPAPTSVHLLLPVISGCAGHGDP